MIQDKPPALEVEFFDGRGKQTIPAMQSKNELPAKIYELSVRMMDWYHALGKYGETSAEDLIRQYPSYLLRVEGFTLEIEGGGEKYPDGMCLAVFNPDSVVVDERNFMYPEPGKTLPEKWGHGAFVVDGSRPLATFPHIVSPTLSFSVGSFGVLIYDSSEKLRTRGVEDLFEFSLCVYNKDGMPVFVRRYIYSGLEYDQFQEILDDGTLVVDARNPMVYIPPDPKHTPFIPPQ